jgi:hypothetical protein
MPALDQRFGIDQPLLGIVAHAVRAVTVLQHLAGNHAHAAPLCGGHDGIHRVGVGGGKRQRRGHAVAQQLVQKEFRHAVGIGAVVKTRLVGKV